MTKKTCIACKEEKDITDFYKKKKSLYHTRCKKCFLKYRSREKSECLICRRQYKKINDSKYCSKFCHDNKREYMREFYFVAGIKFPNKILKEL